MNLYEKKIESKEIRAKLDEKATWEGKFCELSYSPRNNRVALELKNSTGEAVKTSTLNLETLEDLRDTLNKAIPKTIELNSMLNKLDLSNMPPMRVANDSCFIKGKEPKVKGRRNYRKIQTPVICCVNCTHSAFCQDFSPNHVCNEFKNLRTED
jgi:hypothetical protein